MTECVVYVRLSQDQKGTEEGIDRQLAECKDWCEARGWTIREIYADNDKSATKVNVVRPRFEDLLRDVSASPVPVVCWHTDRFVRRVADLMRVIALNVNIFGLNSGHFDLSNPAGRAVAITVTAWATYEGEQKALRQKAAHLANRKKGKAWWVNRPFGYNKDGTLHPEESKALVDIYDQVLNGLPILAACRELSAKGFTTSTGKEWTSTSMRHVLMAPRNAGIATHNGEEVGKGQWEPLISEGKYRATVRLLRDPKRRTGGNPLGNPRGMGGRSATLSGFATCGVCEGPVRRVRRKEVRRGDVWFYACTFGHTSAEQEWVDARLAFAVARRLKVVSTELVDSAVNPDEKVKAITTELEELRDHADELADMLGAREMSRAQFASANKITTDRIDELERALASTSLDRAVHDLLDVEDVERHWHEQMTVHARHTAVTHLFDRIVLNVRGPMRRRGGMQAGDVHFYLKGIAEPWA